MNSFSIDEHGCSVHFYNKDKRKRIKIDKQTYRETYEHYGFFHRTMNAMRDMGFTVGKDEEIRKKYRLISHAHWEGKNGDLQFKAEYNPAGFKIFFFQEVQTINTNGGYYDFDKWALMPYRIRLQMRVTMQKLRKFFTAFHLDDESKPYMEDAEGQIKQRLVDLWNHPQKDTNFDLRELDGTPVRYYNMDRDGKEIRNGDIKYTRDYQGYLARGRVYHLSNGTWAIILRNQYWMNKWHIDLFDLSEGDARGRKKEHIPPRAYLEKMRILREAKTKELKREIRRREKR